MKTFGKYFGLFLRARMARTSYRFVMLGAETIRMRQFVSIILQAAVTVAARLHLPQQSLVRVLDAVQFHRFGPRVKKCVLGDGEITAVLAHTSWVDEVVSVALNGEL